MAALANHQQLSVVGFLLAVILLVRIWDAPFWEAAGFRTRARRRRLRPSDAPAAGDRIELPSALFANDIAKIPPAAHFRRVRGTATVGLVLGTAGRLPEARSLGPPVLSRAAVAAVGTSYDGVSPLLDSGQAGGSRHGLGIRCPLIRSERRECTAAGALSVPNFQLALCTSVLFPPKSLSLNHLGPQKILFQPIISAHGSADDSSIPVQARIWHKYRAGRGHNRNAGWCMGDTNCGWRTGPL